MRGTPFDVFGYMPERRRERAMIAQFEADMREVLPRATPAMARWRKAGFWAFFSRRPMSWRYLPIVPKLSVGILTSRKS